MDWVQTSEGVVMVEFGKARTVTLTLLLQVQRLASVIVMLMEAVPAAPADQEMELE